MTPMLPAAPAIRYSRAGPANSPRSIGAKENRRARRLRISSPPSTSRCQFSSWMAGMYSMKRTTNGWSRVRAAKSSSSLVVLAAHDDHVELDRKTGRLGGGNSRLHPAQVAAAGDAGKAFRPQGVEADIQPLHPGLFQIPRHLRQEQAVGGQDQLAQAGESGKPAEKSAEPFAHQRFAAGNPDLFDAEADRGPGHQQQLLIAEHLLVRRAWRTPSAGMQ